MKQPEISDITLADGMFAKCILISERNAWVPQHSHKYDHVSLIAAGGVEAYANGKLMGVYYAPQGILISAGVKHTFKTLRDNTVIACIHRIDRTGEIEVLEEHQLTEGF